MRKRRATQENRTNFPNSRVNQIQVISDSYRGSKRRNRGESSNEISSEFEAKSLRENAKTHEFETSNYER